MFKRGCITIIQKKDVYSLFSVLFYSIAGYGCGHLNERLNRETLSLSLGSFRRGENISKKVDLGEFYQKTFPSNISEQMIMQKLLSILENISKGAKCKQLYHIFVDMQITQAFTKQNEYGERNVSNIYNNAVSLILIKLIL